MLPSGSVLCKHPSLGSVASDPADVVGAAHNDLVRMSSMDSEHSHSHVHAHAHAHAHAHSHGALRSAGGPLASPESMPRPTSGAALLTAEDIAVLGSVAASTWTGAAANAKLSTHDDHLDVVLPSGAKLCQSKSVVRRLSASVASEDGGASSSSADESASKRNKCVVDTHSKDCGHPMIRHDDHFDYLVGNVVMHQTTRGVHEPHGILDLRVDSEAFGLLDDFISMGEVTPKP